MTSKHSYSFGGTGRLAVALAAVCFGLGATSALAQKTTKWTGGGTDDNWSTASNWSNGVPDTGDTLVWDTGSIARLSSNNDIGSLSLASMDFSLAPAGVVLSGQAVTLTGAECFGRNASLNGSVFTINNDLTLPAATLFGGAHRGVFNGVLSGAASSFTKAGPGTYTLSGENTFAGTLAVDAGRLVLDYANNATVIGSGKALTLGGGTLEFKGKSTGATAQTLGAVTVNELNGISTIQVTQNGGAGTALTLGAVTTGLSTGATAARPGVLFDLLGSGGSSVKIGTAISATAGSSTVNGRILIRTAAGQHDFAHNNNDTGTALVAVNSTATIGATTGNNSTDYLFTDTASIGNGNTAVAIAARTIRIAPTLDNQTMTILNVGAHAGGGRAGLIANNSMLYDGGAHNFTIASAAGDNGVSLRAGNNTTGFILYHMGTGTLTLGERVYLADAGATPGNGSSTHLALSGTGLGLIDWKGGVNSVTTGALMIDGVTVRISGAVDPVRLDSTATGKGAMNIVLTGGGVLEAVLGDITRNVGTGAGAIRWTRSGGFSAFGGDRAVNLGGASAQFTWGGTNFVPNDNALLLASNYSNSRIDFQNPLELGTLQRVVQVANGSAAVDARLSGLLSSGLTGGLVKEGAGTLELTNANTYTGETWVRAGTLLVNGNQSAATGLTTVNSGATLGGTGIIGGSVTVNSGGTLAAGASIESLATGALTLNAGSIFAYEMDKSAAAAVRGDLTAVTGNLTLADTNDAILTLSDLGNTGSWSIGDKLTLISYSGAWNLGLFSYNSSILANDSTFMFSGAEWAFKYNDTVAGTNFTADLTGPSYVTLIVVPEPGTFGLMAIFAGAAILRRRLRG